MKNMAGCMDSVGHERKKRLLSGKEKKMTTLFQDVMLEKVTERVGGNCEIRIRKIGKNNGIEKTAIEAVKPGNNSGTLIYLEDFYREDITESEMDRAADQIAETCCTELPIDKGSVVKNVTFWEYAKPRLVFRLVNAEWNAEHLEGHPHREFLDFAVVYHILLSGYDSEQFMTTAVTQDLLHQWGVSEDELYKTAYDNMKEHFPEICQPLSDVLGILDPSEEEKPECELYLLSMGKMLYGAAALIYGEALRNLADRLESDIYILPSSIHEVLLLPAEERQDEDSLLYMVRSINRTQVRRQEWLSDNIYRYHRKNGSISVIRQAEAA